MTETIDFINKISSLNGYLQMWHSGKKPPLELPALINEVDEWLDELKNESPSGSEAWVRVEDLLPDDDVEVMTWVQLYNDTPIQAYYRVKHNAWYGSRELRDCMNDGLVQGCRLTTAPTHWQPLPQPPIK